MRGLANALRHSDRIAEEDVDKALDLFGETDEFWRSIVSQGLLKEEEIFQIYAHSGDFEYIDLTQVTIEPLTLAILPASFCRKEHVLPIGTRGDHLFLAMSDPSNIIAIDDAAALTDLLVAPKIVAPTVLQQTIDRYLRSDDELTALTQELGEEAEADFSEDIASDDDDAPIVRFVNLLISQAIQDRASDIHVEPGAKELKVRFRIDGVLHEMQKADRSIQAGILSRLKIMADIDIAEKRKPQDGRMSINHQSKQIDIRVASLPTVWGEKIIMRILDHDSSKRSLDSIGMSEANLQRFRDAIRKPHGMVLVTGPTGSGKALHVNTRVPTPLGETTMGTLRVGDEVLDARGDAAKVTMVSAVNERPSLYCFTLNDGQRIYADDNHQWMVNCVLGASSAPPLVETLRVLSHLYAPEEIVTLSEVFEMVEMSSLGTHIVSKGALLASLRFADARLERFINEDGVWIIVYPEETFRLMAERLQHRHLHDCGENVRIMTTGELMEESVLYGTSHMMLPARNDDLQEGTLQVLALDRVDPRDPAYGPAVCIAVDSPDETFLCGQDVVTHNSTTLYTTLDEVANPTVNVITVEDPVEKRIDGVNQVQINNKAGLTFPAALKSILRSDPDIVLIGEIRDRETATISVEASLTGHLVLSTLHTNGAPDALPRLIEMGVEPYLVSTAVSCVVAQRLARRLCVKCKEEIEPDRELMERVNFPKVEGQYPRVHRPVGCATCSNTGYLGRLAVLEIMTVTETIERMVVNHAASSELRHQAEQEGLVSLRQDGYRLVVEGLTTIEEILRVCA